MKKLTKKGFTLVELLAVITILGIISAVAVISVSSYLTKTRQEAMENLSKTAYDGFVNYMMEQNVLLNPGEIYPAGANIGNHSAAITLDDLYQDDKIDRPSNPYNTSAMCTGYVYAENPTTNNTNSALHGVDTYKVHVYVDCGSGHEVSEVFPKD